MAISATPRQMELLRFIRGFQLSHGRSPGLMEMSHGIGSSYRSSAFHLLSSLEERGLVRTAHQQKRSVELLIDVAIPRAPDGAPLYFVPIGGDE